MLNFYRDHHASVRVFATARVVFKMFFYFYTKHNIIVVIGVKIYFKIVGHDIMIIFII